MLACLQGREQRPTASQRLTNVLCHGLCGLQLSPSLVRSITHVHLHTYTEGDERETERMRMRMNSMWELRQQGERGDLNAESNESDNHIPNIN